MYVHSMFSSIKVMLHVYCIRECVTIFKSFFFFLLLIEIAEGKIIATAHLNMMVYLKVFKKMPKKTLQNINVEEEIN